MNASYFFWVNEFIAQSKNGVGTFIKPRCSYCLVKGGDCVQVSTRTLRLERFKFFNNLRKMKPFEKGINRRSNTTL